EPSSEKWSPLAISESDSTCCAGELAIETEEPILAVSPSASFTCRASSTGVAASQSSAVLSQLTLRIRGPSGLDPAQGTVSWWSKETMSLPEAAFQSLAVLPPLAVRIRAPSGLNAARWRPFGWSKEATSLPETASQSFAVLSWLAVRILAPFGLN